MYSVISPYGDGFISNITRDKKELYINVSEECGVPIYIMDNATTIYGKKAPFLLAVYKRDLSADYKKFTDTILERLKMEYNKER